MIQWIATVAIIGIKAFFLLFTFCLLGCLLLGVIVVIGKWVKKLVKGDDDEE